MPTLCCNLIFPVCAAAPVRRALNPIAWSYRTKQVGGSQESSRPELFLDGEAAVGVTKNDRLGDEKIFF